MYECCFQWCGGFYVWARQAAWYYTDYHISAVWCSLFLQLHVADIYICMFLLLFRPSLAKYHTHLLTIHPSSSSSHPSSPSNTSQSGTRNWTLTRVGTAEERMGIDREIAILEGKLAEVNNWQNRVKELEILLSQTEAWLIIHWLLAAFRKSRRCLYF